MAKKSKQAKKSKPKKAKVEPVPKGFGTVTPYLAINGAAAAITYPRWEAHACSDSDRRFDPDDVRRVSGR